jgi:XTP/dITP diphosphohydrolase
MDLAFVLRIVGFIAGTPRSGEGSVIVSNRLLVATLNEGKLAELREILADLPFVLCSLKDFPEVVPIEETGNTFVENASLKASGYAMQTHLLTIADDSGLEVKALKGAPGVFSARYAGEHASDAERTEKLLENLSGVNESNRSARFVSAIAVADSSGSILEVSVGICDGQIAMAPRGTHGFGYDPIFLPNGYQVTFSELQPEVKNTISHRARALSSLRNFLRTLTITSSGR